MNPLPPVIRTFTVTSFRRQQIFELRLAVVEGALPQLEAQQPPGLAAEAVLPLQPLDHLAVVEQLALERAAAREDVAHVVARRPPHPLLEWNREAHLVLALRDASRDQRARRP